jgi:hypothetical protein
LIGKIVAGTARYPDYIPGVAELSRAMCMASLPREFTADQRREALEQANRVIPSVDALTKILEMGGRGEMTMKDLLSYLRAQFATWNDFHKDPYDDLQVVWYRANVADRLAYLLSKDPLGRGEAPEWERSAEELNRLYERSTLRYRP